MRPSPFVSSLVRAPEDFSCSAAEILPSPSSSRADISGIRIRNPAAPGPPPPRGSRPSGGGGRISSPSRILSLFSSRVFSLAGAPFNSSPVMTRSPSLSRACTIGSLRRNSSGPRRGPRSPLGSLPGPFPPMLGGFSCARSSGDRKQRDRKKRRRARFITLTDWRFIPEGTPESRRSCPQSGLSSSNHLP